MPTVLDVTGAAHPQRYKGNTIQPMEGISLRPALAGGAVARSQPLFREHDSVRSRQQSA